MFKSFSNVFDGIYTKLPVAIVHKHLYNMHVLCRFRIQHFSTCIEQSFKNFFIQFQNDLLEIYEKVLCSGTYCVV